MAKQGDWAPAEAQIQSYRKSHPDFVEGALVEAQIYMDSHQLIEASHVLESAVTVHPDSIPLLSLYAELLRKLNKPDRAEELLRQCTRYAPNDAQTWERLGDFHLAKMPKESINDFEHARTLAPHDPLTLAGLAAAKGEDGQDAQADFEKAVTQNAAAPEPNAMVDWLYAEYLQNCKNYAASVAEYSAAIREDPTLTDAYFGRGRAYMEMEKWDDAERDLQRSAQSGENQLPSLIQLVRVYRSEGKTEQARQCAAQLSDLTAKRSITRSTGNDIARQLDTAEARIQQHKFAAAADLYSALLQQHPEVDEARLQLARCYMEIGKSEDAEVLVRQYLSRNNSSAQAHALLGRVLLKNGRTTEAKQEFRHAQLLDPLFMDARLGLAACEIFDKDYSGAIRLLEAARSISPKNNDVLLMEAEAQYKNSNRAAALLELHEVLRNDPANPTAASMLRALGNTDSR